ncbi:hypothetical protein, partial [Pseudonocardia nigra]|uniref:hypothetical protein n=1 Tax=Pseudonocardia nigra TaxID=1921578 RepID=UPI001C5E8159
MVADGLTSGQRAYLRWLLVHAPAGVDAADVIAARLGLEVRVVEQIGTAAYVTARAPSGMRQRTTPFTRGGFTRAVGRVAGQISAVNPTDVADIEAAAAARTAEQGAVTAALRDGTDAVAQAGLRGGWAARMLQRAARGRGVVATATRIGHALRLDGTRTTPPSWPARGIVVAAAAAGGGTVAQAAAAPSG